MTGLLAVLVMLLLVAGVCAWADRSERRRRHRQVDQLADWHRYQHRTR